MDYKSMKPQNEENRCMLSIKHSRTRKNTPLKQSKAIQSKSDTKRVKKIAYVNYKSINFDFIRKTTQDNIDRINAKSGNFNRVFSSVPSKSQPKIEQLNLRPKLSSKTKRHFESQFLKTSRPTLFDEVSLNPNSNTMKQEYFTLNKALENSINENVDEMMKQNMFKGSIKTIENNILQHVHKKVMPYDSLKRQFNQNLIQMIQSKIFQEAKEQENLSKPVMCDAAIQVESITVDKPFSDEASEDFSDHVSVYNIKEIK